MMTGRPSATAAPFRPCVLGNVGYAGGVTPVQAMARISDDVTSYRPTQWKLRPSRMHSAASLARLVRSSARAVMSLRLPRMSAGSSIVFILKHMRPNARVSAAAAHDQRGRRLQTLLGNALARGPDRTVESH